MPAALTPEAPPAESTEVPHGGASSEMSPMGGASSSLLDEEFAIQESTPAPTAPLIDVTPSPAALTPESRLRRREERPIPPLESSAETGAASKGILYCLFAAALLPLAIHALSEDDTAERLDRTRRAHPDWAARVENGKDLSLDAILAGLPEGRIEGAHLPRATWVHWIYALLAATGFVLAIVVLFERGNATLAQIVAVGAGMATFGIIFLLALQWIAEFTQGLWFQGHGLIVIAFYILKFIGFSYRAAMDPNNGFVLSFLGFTCGVGFCEELTKLLPVAWHFRNGGSLNWRGACVWGLASGIGFGIAEGLMYSSQYYNGLATGGIYIVRFISCVALHATWSAATAMMAYRTRTLFAADWEWGDMGLTLLKVLWVPMVLHGLYDTLLKKDMTALALVTAAASFAWLIVLVESARRQELIPATA